MTGKKTAEERRAEITKAAKKLFREKGYNDTAVSDIVNEAGVAQGTFYLYFGSKDDVLAAVADEVAVDRCAMIGEIVYRDDIGAMEKMKQVLHTWIEMGNEEKGWAIEYHEPRFKQLHDKLAERALAEFFPFVVEVIEQGVSEGVFTSKFPAADAAFIIFSGSIDNSEVIEKAALTKEQWIEAYRRFVFTLLGIKD